MSRQEELEENYATGSLRDRMPALEGSRVLWGRVGVLIFLIGWAFVLGRCTAPGGVPPEEHSRVRQDLRQTSAELRELRDRQASPAPAPSPDAAASPSPSPSPSPTSQTHIVKSGDTLRGISLRYYDTTAHANLIAEANNVESGNLKVGQQLIIPPEPED